MSITPYLYFETCQFKIKIRIDTSLEKYLNNKNILAQQPTGKKRILKCEIAKCDRCEFASTSQRKLKIHKIKSSFL